jgi:outer membrane protein TolC
MTLTGLALFAVLTMPAAAQPLPQEASAALPDDPADATQITLSDCLRRALEFNLDLAIVKKDPEIAEHNVTFQKAVFDPILGAAYTHSETEARDDFTDDSTPTLPPVYSNFNSKTDNLNGDVSGFTPIGATYRVGVAWSKFSTDPTFRFDPNTGITTLVETENRYHNYFAHFELPLLKGLGRDVNEEALLVARNDLDISERELLRRAELTVKFAGDAYWDLRAAREATRVANQALKLAQDLFELNKKKVEVGTLAPIEITQAEANVASNVEGTIRARLAVKNSEDNLRRVMAVPADDPLWQATIVPTETPVSEPVTIDQGQAIATALENRAEIANAREQIDSAKVSEKAAHNGVRHQLNLTADINLDRSETPSTTSFPVAAPPIPPRNVTSILRQSPSWAVGLAYVYPIGNRAAKSSYAIAKINTEKSETVLASVSQDVRVEVRTAARAVETGYERVVAARKNVELQTKKLDAEQKKFDNGMSTSFEVFTFQTDLRNAQLSLIQALLDYNKALSELERSKGTLLESKGLKLADDAGR